MYVYIYIYAYICIYIYIYTHIYIYIYYVYVYRYIYPEQAILAVLLAGSCFVQGPRATFVCHMQVDVPRLMPFLVQVIFVQIDVPM